MNTNIFLGRKRMSLMLLGGSCLCTPGATCPISRDCALGPQHSYQLSGDRPYVHLQSSLALWPQLRIPPDPPR